MVQLTDHEIEQRVRSLLSSLLSMDLPAASEHVTMENIPIWDSMQHVQLVVGIEQDFRIEADADLIEAQNLTALVEAVRSKLAARSEAMVTG
jgi:acyl carrier protein